jgi:imidazolonepropionase-like amidohydrolase
MISWSLLFSFGRGVMTRLYVSIVFVLYLASCGQSVPLTQGDLLIAGGAIVDPDAGEVSVPTDVLISDGKIAAIAAAGSIRVARDIEIIDASDMFLMPGLIDVHAHIGNGGLAENSEEDRRAALAQFVRYGVTSIFVPGGGGGNDAQLAAWKVYCDVSTNRCPRVFGSGSIITAYGSHPITTIWGLPADTDPAVVLERGAIGIEEDHPVELLVQQKLAAGVDALKIVVEDGPGAFAPKPRLSKQKIAEICAGAGANGLRVFAHVSLAEHVKDVVDGGCDGIMHAPDDVIPDEVLRNMADRGIYFVATLSLFDALMDQEAGRRVQEEFAIAGVSPRALQSLEDDRYWDVSPESPELITEWQSALDWNLTRAHALGVPLALGTDTSNPQIFPGYSVHEELALMVSSGLSNAAALKSATITAAEFLEREDELGRIASGFRADILVLRHNPLEDIRNTRSVEFVLIDGTKLDDVVSDP